MTKVVDRLQRAEYVSRDPDPSDRRGVSVHLEPAGTRVVNAAAATYDKGRTRVLDRLTAGESKKIDASLRRLLDVLEADRSER